MKLDNVPAIADLKKEIRELEKSTEATKSIVRTAVTQTNDSFISVEKFRERIQRRLAVLQHIDFHLGD